MSREAPSLSDMEILERIQGSRDYAFEQAEKMRNQAIGALGFAALILGLAGYLLIKLTVKESLKELGEEEILRRAEIAAEKAEAAQVQAVAGGEQIEDLKAKYLNEVGNLKDIKNRVGSLGRIVARLQASDQRVELGACDSGHYYPNKPPLGVTSSSNSPRYVDKQIRFSREFDSTPRVYVAFSHLDASREFNLRAMVLAENVTMQGFDCRFQTWAESRVFQAKAVWLAIGSTQPG